MMKPQTIRDTAPPSTVITVPLERLAAAMTDHDIRLESCSELESIVVRTRHSVYELIVLSGDAGEVMIRGGQFFPEFRRANLVGSTFGGSCVKLHSICVGLKLELRVEGESFLTSRIRAVSPGPQLNLG